MGHMNNSCVKLLEDKHRVKTWCIYIYIYGFTVIHPVMGILITGLKELPMKIE